MNTSNGQPQFSISRCRRKGRASSGSFWSDMSAPVPAPGAGSLTSLKGKAREIIKRLDNPARAGIVESWSNAETNDAFLARWRGSLVELQPAAAGGDPQWAVIQNDAADDGPSRTML